MYKIKKNWFSFLRIEIKLGIIYIKSVIYTLKIKVGY